MKKLTFLSKQTRMFSSEALSGRWPAFRSRAAFSLIEVCIVAAIIAILSIIAFSAVKSISQQSKKVGCISHLRQIGVAMLAFASDHNGQLPYDQNQRDYNSPYAMIGDMRFPDRGLVGRMGSQGYLPWNGDASTPIWSDIFLCPGDPNRDVYFNLRKTAPGDAYPGSYLYRQNTNAAGQLGDPINIRRRVDGVLRWIVRDRHIYGHGPNKPYTGREGTLAQPAHMGAGDRVTTSSFWHRDETNVLYEDGSVRSRKWGETLGISL